MDRTTSSAPSSITTTSPSDGFQFASERFWEVVQQQVSEELCCTILTVVFCSGDADEQRETCLRNRLHVGADLSYSHTALILLLLHAIGNLCRGESEGGELLISFLIYEISCGFAAAHAERIVVYWQASSRFNHADQRFVGCHRG